MRTKRSKIAFIGCGSHTVHCAFASQRRDQSTRRPVPSQSPFLVTFSCGHISFTDPFSRKTNENEGQIGVWGGCPVAPRFCPQNNRLDAVRVLGDAAFQCQNQIPTYSFFGGIPFSLVGESATGYSMPLLRFACSHLRQFPYFCFCSNGSNPRNGNGKLGRIP